MKCFFVSDIHGKISRYEKLFEEIIKQRPGTLFMGGDLLPHGMKPVEGIDDFTDDFLIPRFRELKKKLGEGYPEVFIILGNDDARSEEEAIRNESLTGTWHYAHCKWFDLSGYRVCGYSYVPPTPFRMKDWEKYDVSRFVDPGCIPPTEGFRTVEPVEDIEYGTIKKDLEKLSAEEDIPKSIFLFHSPPYKTKLDRAALDGRMVDHVPLDVHVGSIAITRFIEDRKPYLTLHGHIHESTRLTGHWKERLGSTLAFNAANDSEELAIINFDLNDPESAERILL